MSSKRFGGLTLSEIAKTTSNESQTSGTPPTPHTSAVPIGELAMRGAQPATHERVTILQVDPKRCRAWAFHDRHPSWYTRERCLDLIESLSKDEQQEPALARKLPPGGEHDYELIYGMRRRFACELLNRSLKIQVTTADNQRCAVLMHIENADRKDITPMERAMSFARQLRDKLFRTQEEMALAKNVSKGLVTQMVKAAELLEVDVIAKLFPDPTVVPISGAYKVASRMSDSSSREVIIAAARHLAKKADTAHLPAPAILKLLITAPERSVRTELIRKPYNVGTAGRMILTRNAQGKVTLAFPDGIQATAEEEIIATVRRALKDLGE